MKKQSAALLLTLALALPLGGCASQPAEEGPKEEVTAERVVQYGLSNPWDSLMPYNSPSGSNYSRIIYDKIYDRLAYVHADGTVTARAAQSWESVEDGYGIVFIDCLLRRCDDVEPHIERQFTAKISEYFAEDASPIVESVYCDFPGFTQQCHSGNQPRQPEAMVAMQMADENVPEPCILERHLAQLQLCPFAAIYHEQVVANVKHLARGKVPQRCCGRAAAQYVKLEFCRHDVLPSLFVLCKYS